MDRPANWPTGSTDVWIWPGQSVYYGCDRRERINCDEPWAQPWSTTTTDDSQLAGRYKMEWSITYRNRKQKLAILVSKDDHW